jgi:hypothetical protein
LPVSSADSEPMPLGAALLTGTAGSTTLSAGSTVATTVTFHPNMIGDEAIKVAVRRAVARLA